jgi:hypothetical protein
MDTLLWKSPNGLWEIHRDEQHKWTLWIIGQYNSQSAIVYEHDRSVAYDDPYRLPKYVKEAVKRIAKRINVGE